jgi:hypothetical protein
LKNEIEKKSIIQKDLKKTRIKRMGIKIEIKNNFDFLWKGEIEKKNQIKKRKKIKKE